jgi:hypothetical protein
MSNRVPIYALMESFPISLCYQRFEVETAYTECGFAEPSIKHQAERVPYQAILGTCHQYIRYAKTVLTVILIQKLDDCTQ